MIWYGRQIKCVIFYDCFVSNFAHLLSFVVAAHIAFKRERNNFAILIFFHEMDGNSIFHIVYALCSCPSIQCV